MSYAAWFERLTGVKPHPWQEELGDTAACSDRLLRIPTGFGKTAGTVLAWLYRRVEHRDTSWPTRLVFVLPMRVLVEQTEAAVSAWIAKAGLDVPVVVLLGGRHESTWLEHPERPTIVIGTQDMLLSRALGRGYGSSRGMWPMEMGFVNSDTLWVIDEVQLMDVGLATTTQLHGFRRADALRARTLFGGSFCWWMSATLQPSWLDSIDFAAHRAALTPMRVPPERREGGLWSVTKKLEVRADVGTPEEIAEVAAAHHERGTLSLVVVNTVDRARKVASSLAKKKIRFELVHSRFRGAERKGWAFLRRDAELPPEGRVIVATQVVEAGVDISASNLVTDLAPWSSLVQRFGRCARYEGQKGRVVVAGAPVDEKRAAPYRLEELAAAARALDSIGEDVGPAALERFEEELEVRSAETLAQLYPYEPLHVLRRRDFDDLFDTTPDLSGADLDVSRYIRSGEERDVSVFWRDLGEAPPRELDMIEAPSRDELCPVPVGELRGFIGEKVAYARDYLDGRWRRVTRLVPGMTVLVAASAGGYDLEKGWDPATKGPVRVVSSPISSSEFERASAAADAEDLSEHPWKTIRTHGRETAEIATALAQTLGLNADISRVLAVAGCWHDAGKAHAAFQSAIRDDARREAGAIGGRADLAKAPREAWRKPPYPERPGFRHELASTLMILETLRRAAPEHGAMLGLHVELLAAIGQTPLRPTVEETIPATGAARDLVALSAEHFDLLLFLVCAHHGKVRTSWSTTPRDQDAGHGGIHGVCDGDSTGSLALAGVSDGGTRVDLPSLTLSLACSALGLNARYGASWGERVSRLFERFGPFGLSYLEGLFRVADWRASQLDTPEEP